MSIELYKKENKLKMIVGGKKCFVYTHRLGSDTFQFFTPRISKKKLLIHPVKNFPILCLLRCRKISGGDRETGGMNIVLVQPPMVIVSLGIRVE